MSDERTETGGSQVDTIVSRSRFKKGKKIETLTEAICRIVERKPFYWRHKFMAAGFIEHWSVVQIGNAVKHGVLRTADKIDRA